VSDSEWWLVGMEQEPAPAPARRASSAWPRCGARTRSGRACVAPGAGIGFRCPNHGGLAGGVRDFVLMPGLDWRERDADEPRAWSARIVPTKVWRSVTMEGALDFDDAYPVRIDGRWHGDLRRVDERDGRHVVKHWPQLIGLRVARRLMERGRITHAVVPDTRAARKLRTLRPSGWTDEQWEAWLEKHTVVPQVHTSARNRL
jgi:hypothetical protein